MGKPEKIHVCTTESIAKRQHPMHRTNAQSKIVVTLRVYENTAIQEGAESATCAGHRPQFT